MIRTATTLALLLSATSLASAQSIDDAITDFIHADGFEAQPSFDLEDALSGNWLDTHKITPGGTVGPLEKAMLIADQAIASNRTRSFISYGEMLVDEDSASVPYSFIEIRHYNLGPTIHAETVEAYGAENTGDIEEFGTGDHMAWRFVFRPLMGTSAALMDASSRVITPKPASRQDCNGAPCLSTAPTHEDMAAWEEITGESKGWPLNYSDMSDEITTPAYAISSLATLGYWANAESGEYEWTGGEHPEAARGYEPYRFISVERNLGQEIGLDTVWRETLLNDDSIRELLFRHIDIAGYHTVMRASVER